MIQGAAVQDEEVDAEVARLVGLGATKQQVWDEPEHYSWVMLDPEGNEFWVSRRNQVAYIGCPM